MSVLKITKADKTVHFVPLSSKSFFEGRNNLLPVEKRSKIEEVDESEAENFKGFKDPDFYPGVDTALAEKNAEIEELKRQLAEAKANQGADNTANAAAGGTAAPALSRAGNATDAIATIATLNTVDEVNAFTAGEERATVVKAAAARIKELTK